MIVIQYENTIDDLVNFSLFNYYNSRSFRRQEYIIKLSLPIFFLLVFIIPNISENLLISLLFLWFSFSAFYLLAIHHFFRFYLKFTFKKLYAEDDNKTNLGIHIIKLEENGIIEEARNKITKINWDGITKVIKDNNYIFIYTSAVEAFIIPIQAIEDSNELSNISDFISTKLKTDITIQTINKPKKELTGIKKFVSFLISIFSVYILMFPVLSYGLKYDNRSVSILLIALAIFGAVIGTKYLSKYSWSVIVSVFLLSLGCGIVLILLLE